MILSFRNFQRQMLKMLHKTDFRKVQSILSRRAEVTCSWAVICCPRRDRRVAGTGLSEWKTYQNPVYEKGAIQTRSKIEWVSSWNTFTRDTVDSLLSENLPSLKTCCCSNQTYNCDEGKALMLWEWYYTSNKTDCNNSSSDLQVLSLH